MTKLEKNSPELRKLAKELNMDIYYRGGEYWADGPMEIQLTYRVGNIGNGEENLCSIEKRIETAMYRFKKVKEARHQPEWGSKKERFERVLKGVIDEAIPNYKRGSFCYWNHNSLDYACLLTARGEYTIWIKLVGEKEIEVTGNSWEDCVLQLTHSKI